MRFNLKKVLSLILILSLTFSTVVPVYAEGETVTLSYSDDEIYVGDVFTIDVSVNSVDFSGAQVAIHYDKTKVIPVNASNNAITQAQTQNAVIKNEHAYNSGTGVFAYLFAQSLANGWIDVSMYADVANQQAVEEYDAAGFEYTVNGETEAVENPHKVVGATPYTLFSVRFKAIAAGDTGIQLATQADTPTGYNPANSNGYAVSLGETPIVCVVEDAPVVTVMSLPSTAPNVNNITVTNNYAGTNDTVAVSGLAATDVVKVYDAATDGAELGTATVAAGQTSATVDIAQLGLGAGDVWVTVTNTGKAESTRVQKSFTAEQTQAPVVGNIAVTNNVSGTPDTVEVTGLLAGDEVIVYSLVTGGTELGTGTVAAGETSVIVSIDQLGTTAGSVFVTVTNAGGRSESAPRVEKAYIAEPETTTAPAEADITVTNNRGDDDTVEVTGLQAGDVIRVYDAASAGTELGTATVAAGQTSVTITIAQLGVPTGSVYVSAERNPDLESGRTEKTYAAEATTAPAAGDITVTNNVGAGDTIEVTGLAAGDVVKVYTVATGGTAIGTGTVAAGETDVTVTAALPGTTNGTVYVTVTNAGGYAESNRTAKTYLAEPVATTAPAAANITVSNNRGDDDTVVVTGLQAGDVIRVYDAASAGTQLGTATVAAGQTSVSITIAQLGVPTGSVYVSSQRGIDLESGRTAKAYAAEATTAPDAGNITVTNNVGAGDTIEVTGLAAGDVVKVYTVATGGTAIGTGTVAAGETDVTVTAALPGTTNGTVYVTVTNAGGYAESNRTAKTYLAEPVATTAPAAANITVSNNRGDDDTVVVTGLQAGDVIRVYDAASAGTQLGTATVAAGQTSVSITIAQLGVPTGSVYVSSQRGIDLESGRTAKAYAAEATTAPDAGNITVTNNVGAGDTIEVTGLAAGDVVKVYTVATGGTAIGTGTVAAGETDVTVTAALPGTTNGTVYVTVTNAGGYAESNRTAKTYLAEPVATTAPAAANITVTNNKTGTSDTVVVTGLQAGDVIRVYDAASAGTQLGTATVAAGQTSVTVTIAQLGVPTGTVYVSSQRGIDLESSRTAKAYIAEPTDPVAAGNITIVNKVGAADTIAVTGLLAGDVVKVYATSTSTTVLGTATVASGQTSVTVSVPQLGSLAGNAYITVTSTGLSESTRTEKAYLAEVYPFDIEKVGSLNTSGGVKATVTVNRVADTLDHAGVEVIVFQLMNGSTPVSINAIEKDIQSLETISAIFHGQTGTSVNVMILTELTNSITQTGVNLAAPELVQ